MRAAVDNHDTRTCYDGSVGNRLETSAQPLRVLVEPNTPGVENMRRDTALLEACHAASPVTLRLYSWRRPTVSVGWMQDPTAFLNVAACAEAGVDGVRRPTGGRAILHADEITYAVVAPLHDRRFGTSVAESHAVIGACLARGLASLGVETTLSRPTPGRQRHLIHQPCFASTGRAELLVDGRKLVGSAQRRCERAFLQHGSLLIDRGHERLVDFLIDAARDARLAHAMRRSLREATATLRDQLGRTPGFRELAEALTHGFAAQLGADVIQSTSPT